MLGTLAHAPSKTHLAAGEGDPDGIVVFIPIFTRRAEVPTLVRAPLACSAIIARTAEGFVAPETFRRES